MKKYLFLILFLPLLTPAAAQTARDLTVSAGKEYKRARYGSALDKYLQSYKKKQDPRVLFNIADAHYYLKDYAAADKIYKEIEEQHPKRAADALFNQGNVLYRQGDLDGAAEIYKKILLKNPKDKAALFNLQISLEDKKEDENSKNKKQDESDQKDKNQSDENQPDPSQNSAQNQQQKEEEMERLLQMAREQEQKNQTRLAPKHGENPLSDVEKDW